MANSMVAELDISLICSAKFWNSISVMASRVNSGDCSSKSRSTVSLTLCQCRGLIAGFFRSVINGRVRLNLSTFVLKKRNEKIILSP